MIRGASVPDTTYAQEGEQDDIVCGGTDYFAFEAGIDVVPPSTTRI